MGYLNQIKAGSFVSNASPRVLEFDGSPDIVRLYYQGNASGDVWIADGATPALKELYWNRNMGAGTGLGTRNVASNDEDEKVFFASGGVSAFEPSYGEFGPNITITGVSQANPARVTATAHGLATGDQVIITGVAGMAQINSLVFQITVIDANNFDLNGLNSSGFAAAGTGGVAKRVLYPGIWQPQALTPIAITQAAQAVITTSINHGYVAGQEVLLTVPADFGMVQADGKIAEIVSVTANTMTIDLNTTGFTAFAFPASGAPLGVPSVTNYATQGSLVLNSYRNDGFKGIYLGASVAGSNGALVHYEIIQADFFDAV
jgi:hypothetical protein